MLTNHRTDHPSLGRPQSRSLSRSQAVARATQSEFVEHFKPRVGDMERWVQWDAGIGEMLLRVNYQWPAGKAVFLAPDGKVCELDICRRVLSKPPTTSSQQFGGHWGPKGIAIANNDLVATVEYHANPMRLVRNISKMSRGDQSGMALYDVVRNVTNPSQILGCPISASFSCMICLEVWVSTNQGMDQRDSPGGFWGRARCLAHVYSSPNLGRY
ncbi:hypothetical protein C8R44DRAFT_349185 [Mycena epipterygia]|nr:hypothetical protein C8R44DRAFT_349185 [Mycena epipterygia]